MSHTFLAFHGTYTDQLPTRATTFGGFHAGSFKAALDRLLDTFPSSGGGSLGKNKPGYIFLVEITLSQPFPSATERLDETELSVAINLNQIKSLKSQGYDGIIYENIAEDPGSTSYLVFDMKNIRQVDNPFIISDLSQRYEEKFS